MQNVSTEKAGQYHRFQSFLLLGINRDSNVKEGAWTFLEYLLSEETQQWEPQAMGYFPVRREGFAQYISVEGIDNAGSPISAAQEEKDALQELAEHAYLDPYRLYDPLYDIILEECDAYFAGDKSIEQVTGNIQNRVTLYLQEKK